MLRPLPSGDKVRRSGNERHASEKRGATKLIAKTPVKVAVKPKVLVYDWPAPTNCTQGLFVAWDTLRQKDRTNYYEIQRKDSLTGPWYTIGETNRPPFVMPDTGSGFLRILLNVR